MEAVAETFLGKRTVACFHSSVMDLWRRRGKGGV